MPAIFLHSGPQDPTYGLSLEHIAERLTRSNWATKAIIRVSEAGPLYVWIRRAERGLARGPVSRFFRVAVDAVEKHRKDLERDFSELGDALACANGEDDGELAQGTRPGGREDWPAHVTKEPPWTVVFPSMMFRNL